MNSLTIWSTPQKLFDALNAEFRFEYDLCADADNAKCKNFYLRETSLESHWMGRGFLNPPYGREIGKWMAKALKSSLNGARIVCLVPVRSNAPWWHEYVMKADEIRFVRKKLAYDSNNGKRGVPFWPSAIVIFDGSRQTPRVRTQEQ